jgi:hypothetical protein
MHVFAACLSCQSVSSTNEHWGCWATQNSEGHNSTTWTDAPSEGTPPPSLLNADAQWVVCRTALSCPVVVQTLVVVSGFPYWSLEALHTVATQCNAIVYSWGHWFCQLEEILNFYLFSLYCHMKISEMRIHNELRRFYVTSILPQLTYNLLYLPLLLSQNFIPIFTRAYIVLYLQSH